MAGVLLRHRAATLVRSRVLAHGPFPLRCYSRKIEWTAAVLLPKPSHVAAAATFSSGLVLHSLRARQLALCEASLAQHFAAPIIEELDAAEPILQKQSRSSIILEVLACARRAVYLMLVFGPLLIMYPLSRWKWTEELWWRWCVRAFENSGALLIKLAQWGSSRPDMFGERGCRRFLHLQDNTPAHTWSHTERALDSMFGPEWRQELELERTPIGSGCIAQVYRGRLRVRPRVAAALAPCEDEWRPVAVKVLHPRVGEHVATDMRLLAAFGEMLMLSSLRWLNPTAMLAEFAASLTVQLDLTVEASNLDTFRSNFGVDRPSAGGAASRAVGLERSRPLVTFPEPLAPYISRDVLVESFVDGRPFLQWARQLPTDSPERQRICNEGIDAFIQMLFIDNLVHGDLHPGNIFVVEAASGEPSEAQLCFLDAGIAVKYSQAEHEHLIDVLSSFIQYDGYEGGRLIAERSMAPSELRDLDGFCAKIQTMVELARDSPTFFDQIGDCISIICEAACEHRVKMHGSFVSIALSIKVVEGSVIQVDPEAIVAPRAKPIVVREHMRRKGRALLGRSLETGELLDNDAKLKEEALISAARERAARGETAADFNIREEFRAKHPRR